VENLNSIIADNFKAIRIQRGLSLDNVASLTGVSKSMLGQIERGESNPTIATLWKIANGLKVSFSSLVQRPVEENKVIYRSDVAPISFEGSRYLVGKNDAFEFRADRMHAYQNPGQVETRLSMIIYYPNE